MISGMPSPSFGAVASGIFRSMRPHQWTKNLVVFAALVFDIKLLQMQAVVPALLGFAVLCMLSSAVYLINDCADVHADRAHPRKSRRPIASGVVPVPLAVAVAALLIVVGLAAAASIDPTFAVIAALYLALTSAYSFRLKHIVVLDVIVLSLGFVLRVAAGAALVRAENFSPWLYLCMSLLALLLGFGKRRQELVELGDRSTTRRILREYNLPLLDQIVSIVTGALLVSYMMYSFSGAKLPANHSFMLTIPVVLYGVFRYLYLVHVKGEGGAPDELVLRDRPLQLTLAAWGAIAVAVLYLQ
jgi:4-hydroxybenzoate polyprenyltransferase